ncbi:hypothetical protein FHP25_29435 [Vineibacter terrae]|uniref:VOC domain-containing protein n=1 Tax=Vineibacter terrae TaxID=2586908 RepID=A0A5C8PD75_9HYPH|nr:hypothetical protein [Vineibacter terrae]TXL71506.1 hypothetical protein FHP25_29435 [Vineibacter terrae]
MFRAGVARFCGIAEFARHLPTVGAEVINGPKDVPTGQNMLVRHPDGTLVEYVEHRHKHPAGRLAEPGGD